MSEWPTPTHDSDLARLNRGGDPGFSWCLRCGQPWNYVEAHSTPYGDPTWEGGFGMSGCFPLCEGCWQQMDIEQLMPYYRRLVLDVWDGTEELWAAVLFGLEVDCGLRPDPRVAT